MDLSLAARIVALLGFVLLIIAGVLLVIDRLDLPLGDLPGDIKVERKNFTCAVPIVSSLIISILLTVIFNLVLYLLKR
jgi:hypothetical protein